MSNVVSFDRNRYQNYYADCPHCHGLDNIWNVGRDHWAVCHRHKTKWHIGANLFSNWRDESEQDWLRNKYRLANYRTVYPYENVGPEVK